MPTFFKKLLKQKLAAKKKKKNSNVSETVLISQKDINKCYKRFALKITVPGGIHYIQHNCLK